MDVERWRRVEELFDAASRLAPAERVFFLHESCGGDDALRAEVESLLTYHTSAEGFIDAPALDVAARLMNRDWSEAGTSLTGATIAHFRVLEKLGEGGMGVVYAAEDTRLGRTVALKFLRPTVSNPQALERFEREARAASALNHPNICTIYSVQDEGGRPFIEMERLEGQTLRERIAGRALAIDEAVALALQMIDGLDAAHAKGIVHRDLKPGNVFCTPRGVAKILDFGVAKLESAPEADRGAVIGTVAYMSPEQASGQEVDSRTDLFSLGAVLYEMATGRPAFQGPSSAAIRQAIRDTEPIPPRRVNPKVPAALDRIIVKALRKNRELRYQRTSELRADLERLTGHAGRRRRRALAAAVGVFLLLAGTIALWYSPFAPGDIFSTNLRLRQITHNSSEYSVGTAALSPDGRHAAYTDSRGIHITEIDTGVTRRVPESQLQSAGSNWDLTPGWLADGTGLVANLVGGEDAAASSVWTVGVSGEPRKLRDRARAMSLSSDGSSIAFATEGIRFGDRNVWVMGPDGSAARKMFDTDAGSALASLSWSPDARRVAYLRTDANRTAVAIETRALAGGDVSTIMRPDEGQELQGLVWLRDGRLLYSLRQPAMGTSAGRTPCSYWQIRPGPGGPPLDAPRPLAGWLPECVTAVSFSADGKRAMYLQWSIHDTIHVADLDADGGRVASSSRLTFTEGRNIPSGWTSDGRTVVFVSDGAGRVALVRMTIGSDTPEPIAGQPGIVGAARLTPDAASVLYVVQPKRGGSPQQLVSVPVTGGASRLVLTGTFVDGGARCTMLPAKLCAVAERSPDGRQLVFASIELPEGRGRELARVDAEAGGDYRWALSPDGARIALLNARGARIRVLSLTGQAPLEFQVAGRKTLGYVSWSADGKGLVVPSVDARAATLLWVDLQGNARVLWQQPGAIDISGIPSPDGRRMAVWVRSRSANLWLAESP